MDYWAEFEQRLQQDDLLLAKYVNFRSLGQGNQGSVWYAEDADLYARGIIEPVAIKLIALDELQSDVNSFKRRNAIRELENHSRLQEHPFIVPFRHAFASRRFLVIVMDYIPPSVHGRSLEDRLRQLDGGFEEDIARNFIQQIFLAMHYCHGLGITNRDFKLEHCLLEDRGEGNLPKVRICDFGLSIGNSISKSRVGTPGYWAPEVWIQSWKGESYDPKLVDVFALGVGLYRMLFGPAHWPCERPSVMGRLGEASLFEHKVRTVSNGDGAIVFPGAVSPECRDLLVGMLKQNWRERFTLKMVLSHPWVAKKMPPVALPLNDDRIVKSVNLPMLSREEIEKRVFGTVERVVQFSPVLDSMISKHY